jgi:glycerol-3-phosphate dehydrogenase
MSASSLDFRDRPGLFGAVGERIYDLIVIGAGITGAGIARDAARERKTLRRIALNLAPTMPVVCPAGSKADLLQKNQNDGIDCRERSLW